MPREPGLGVRLMLVLALLAATAPFALDLYLPSFPRMVRDLGTGPSQVQLTLTAFAVGLGIGQIAWGPFSDRFGRRGPLLVGTGLFVLASAAVALAPTIEVLVVARFVQALVAAGGIVAARAIVADSTRGFASAQSLSVLTSLSMIAPVIAPIAGGLLVVTIDWRGVLWTLFGITVLMFIGVLTTVRESLPPERRASRVDFRNVVRALRRPAFLGYALTATLNFGALLAYIAASAFVYQTVIGFSPVGNGIAFAVNACGLIVAGLVSARMAKRRIHPARVVFVALGVLVAMAAVILVIALSGLPAITLIVPIFFAVTATGFIAGNCVALAFDEVRDITGTGSGLTGGIQMILAGLVSPLVGIAGEASAVPLGAVMTGCALAALACFAAVRAYARRHRRDDDAFASTPPAEEPSR